MTISCTASSVWNPLPPPACEKVVCPNPANLPQGYLINQQAEYRFEDVVQYDCNEGHEFISNIYSATCQVQH